MAASEQLNQIVILGFDDVKAANASLIANFGLSTDQCSSLLARVPIVVKQDASDEETEQYMKVLRKGSLHVEARQQIVEPPQALVAKKKSKTKFLLSHGKSLLVATLLIGAGFLGWAFWPDKVVVHVVQAGAADGSQLILLHGYGATGDDFVGLGNDLVAMGLPSDIRVVVPEGPYKVGMRGHAWSKDGDLTEAKNAVRHLLSQAQGEVVVAGFSQGADVAEALAIEGHANLSGVAVLSPTSKLESWVSEQVEPADPEFGVMSKKTSWQAHISLPALVTHGNADAINPLEPMKEIYAALQKGDQSVRVVEFEGGHALPTQVRKSLAIFTEDLLGSRARIARVDLATD